MLCLTAASESSLRLLPFTAFAYDFSMRSKLTGITRQNVIKSAEQSSKLSADAVEEVRWDIDSELVQCLLDKRNTADMGTAFA